jgi:Holliday junction resolvase RusA-like endonuclease
MIELIIPGEPVAKGRPRVTSKGFSYTPEKTKGYENLVKMCWQESGLTGLGNKPLSVIISLYFSVPKSYLSKFNKHGLEHTKKPDLDNCAKTILDALNGLAYDDDSQIVELTIRKQYSTLHNCAVVRIKEE